jgi:predicted ATPase
MTNQWYVITGGPCSGKTTLVNALAEQGYHTVPEVARTLLERGLAAGKTVEQIHEDDAVFQRALLAEKVAAEAALPTGEVVFLDRGIPDSVAYFERAGIADDPALEAALMTTRYRKAFLLDLLPYVNDPARVETEAEAKKLHERIAEAYEKANIEVVRVPVMPLPERIAFVLSHL